MKKPISGEKIVALIPMRHDSERVLAKNRRLFAGKPLYAYIIETALRSNYISSVVVDTDSEEIKKGIMDRYENKISIIDRPYHLRDGSVPMNDVLVYDVENVNADIFVQTHATNPFLKSETIDKAIKCYCDNHLGYDSLFSVTRRNIRLWDGQMKAVNHDPNKLIRTQDLSPIYEENSCIYIFRKEVLLNTGRRIGRKPMMYEMNKLESLDIDEEDDFILMEKLYKHLNDICD